MRRPTIFLVQLVHRGNAVSFEYEVGEPGAREFGSKRAGIFAQLITIGEERHDV